MNGNPRVFFEFDGFRVDVEERRLLRDGKSLTVTPRVFDILLTLIESSGETVAKDTLLEKVWTNAFVEEGNLHHYISALRKLLGDDPRRQRLIKTIPKHGYRFTGQVRRITQEQDNFTLERVARGKLVITEERHDTFWTSRRLATLGTAAILITCSMIAAAVYSSRAGEAALRTRPAVSTNAEAAQLIAQGRALWQTRDAGDLHRALLMLERAVALDPGSAAAHAALADVYAFDYTYWKKAETEANAAIALDPYIGQPHATLGFIRAFWEWKLLSAEAEFKRAQELNPSYATAHQWYALDLVATGHGDAALIELGKALDLEPDSLAINGDLCQVLYFHHMYDQAIAQCRKTIDMNDQYLPAHEHLVNIYLAVGLGELAVSEYLALEEIRHVRGVLPPEDRKLKYIYEHEGLKGFLTSLAAKMSGPLTNEYELAKISARLADDERALEFLSQAFDKRNFDFVFIQADPAFDRFHNINDPIFSELKDRLLH